MKAIRSIIASSSIANIIKKNYCFSNQISCHLIKGGGSSDIYKILDNEKSYIFRVYSAHPCWRYNEYHYVYETNIQNYLHANHIDVPNPIKNKFDSFITKINTPEYKKFCALTSSLEGEPWNFKLLDTQRASSVGQSLAIMHDVGKKYNKTHQWNKKRNINIEFLLTKPYERIQKLMIGDNQTRINHIIHSYVKELVQNVSDIHWENIERGFVHGDMHILNHLYNTQNKKIGFMDFEFCGYGYPIYDIATFKGSLLSQVNDKNASILWDSFLEGYSSIKKINDYELKIINFFIRLRHLFYVGSTFIAYPEFPQYQNVERIASCLEDKFYEEKLDTNSHIKV
jgi:Ser/Thr protein kinase RdoA (MazF antagonist)